MVAWLGVGAVVGGWLFVLYRIYCVFVFVDYIYVFAWMLYDCAVSFPVVAVWFRFWWLVVLPFVVVGFGWY